MPLLFAFAAAAVSPQPGELKTFKDWIVGCDNGRACQAVGLLADGGAEGATIVVQRDAGPDTVPKIAVISDAKAVGLTINGARSAFKLIPNADGFQLSRDDAMAFATTLTKADRLALVDIGGKPLATISLAGASAALRYIDDKQKRVGTMTAMVAKGPAQAVPVAPALPVVTVPRRCASATQLERCPSDGTAWTRQYQMPLPERQDRTRSLAARYAHQPCDGRSSVRQRRV